MDKRKFVEAKVRVHLNLGKSITPHECRQLYKGDRLASIIHRLKKKGLNIEKEMVYEGPDQFARYSLKKTTKKQKLCTTK